MKPGLHLGAIFASWRQTIDDERELGNTAGMPISGKRQSTTTTERAIVLSIHKGGPRAPNLHATAPVHGTAEANSAEKLLLNISSDGRVTNRKTGCSSTARV